MIFHETDVILRVPVLKFCYVHCFVYFAHQVTTYPRIFETSYDPVEMIWNTNDERVKAKYSGIVS